MSRPVEGGANLGRRLVLSGAASLAASWPMGSARASAVDGRGVTEADLRAGFAALSTASIRFQDGGHFELGSFRGRALLVNFWANWCRNCLAEFGSMVELQKAARGPQQLAVVLVSQAKDWEKDQAFARQTSLPFSLAVLDEPATPSGDRAKATLLLGNVVGRQTVFGLPLTYVVSRSGQLVWVSSGDTSWLGSVAVSKAARALHS